MREAAKLAQIANTGLGGDGMSRRLIASHSASGFLLFLLLVGSISTAAAQTCPSNVPHVDGVWRTLPYLFPINPISATLLSNGRVLIVSGSENNAYNSEGSETYRFAVWDPTRTDESSIVVQNIGYDVFCSGTAVLPDGRPLTVGGTQTYQFTGDNRASIFNPLTSQFPQSQSMVAGRWYATATELGDGGIVAFSGTDETSSYSTNNTVEIYDLADAGAGWSSPVTAPFTPPLFPRMELLPNGSVFFTGQGSGLPCPSTCPQSTPNGWLFDPWRRTWTQSATVTTSRTYGSAVILPLLPPNYTPRVMNFGGNSTTASTNSTETIDLSAASPTWTPGPNMSTARVMNNAVILPNGTVLSEGGSVDYETPDTPGKHADVYDPVMNAFSSGGTAAYSRLYHSTTLLLPDATVMSLGSNPVRGSYEPAIEIYTPSYLFDANDRPIVANRPTITNVSVSVLGYAAPFTVSYTSSNPIGSAVLMRPGSVTHSFNFDQRLVGLCGPSPQPACSPGSGTLSLTTPPNGNVAPPGYYMLFLLDSAGVPSKAQFIQLTRHSSTPPTDTITSPASNVTITAGNSVNFGTTSTSYQYSWIFPGGFPATSTLQNPGNVTFNTPGTYLTTLTAIDSFGNTDPNPPTRQITVLPSGPDFSIVVSPVAAQVFPGQSATFTVTITPETGFNGTVSLSVASENGFPTGITSGGFSPPSISGSGSSTLTMNTTTDALPYALSLPVTGTSGTLTDTGSTTLLVNLAAPTNLTTATTNSGVSLSWTGSTGATGYHVKRALASGGPYIGIGCPTSKSFTDTTVVNGTTYYYVVSADYTGGVNAGGESTESTEASGTAIGTPPTLIATYEDQNSDKVGRGCSLSPGPLPNIHLQLSGLWEASPASIKVQGIQNNGAVWFEPCNNLNWITLVQLDGGGVADLWFENFSGNINTSYQVTVTYADGTSQVAIASVPAATPTPTPTPTP
jgi:hypothetical protein